MADQSPVEPSRRTPSRQTLEQVVSAVAERFDHAGLCYGHGTDNAWDEAAALVLHALGWPPADPAPLDLTPSETQMQLIESLAEQRISTRAPLAYLIGETGFAGLRLKCDARALVPRSPIAELIEERFQPWLQPEKVKRILDLCTGGGAIALACAHAFPQAQVDAADISEQALALARENATQLGLSGQLRFLQGDLFSPIDQLAAENPQQGYDLIVSNPPYVPASSVKALPDEFKHEPELGLLADDQGLEIAHRILAQARKHLRPGGVLIVEVGESDEALAQSYPDLPFTWLEFARGGEGVFLLERDQLPVSPVAT